ncbi:MAG: hypothetical protein XE08_0731 [Parcubacteria bacterium 32_520]|nr:MAG: hypothetical protein XE08_0731 [Parcubacteria bacterium 32_520]
MKVKSPLKTGGMIIVVTVIIGIVLGLLYTMTSSQTDFSNMMGAIIAANKIFEQQKKEPSAKSGSPSSPKEEKIYTDQEIEELLERVGRKRNR